LGGTGCGDGVFAAVGAVCEKGLIEGVYGSSVGDVPPSEELQEMVEKMTVWVSEAESKEAALSPLPSTLEQ